MLVVSCTPYLPTDAKDVFSQLELERIKDWTCADADDPMAISSRWIQLTNGM